MTRFAYVKPRAGWDTYFLQLATMAATRSTCDRLHVGCVIVKDRSVIATGYNGSTRGADHCDDVGHDMVDGHCVRVVHAEANAVAQSAVSLKGSTVYVTHYPCRGCAYLLVNAGVARIVYGHAYRTDERTAKACEVAGVELVCHS